MSSEGVTGEGGVSSEVEDEAGEEEVEVGEEEEEERGGDVGDEGGGRARSSSQDLQASGNMYLYLKYLRHVGEIYTAD